ncbi:MAG: nucleoside 2-deoxyribosyltransferase [Candidatus Woesearchaeota archaeon]
MVTKIYFAGSIRGGRDDKELYLQLIKHLAKYGKVLTEHVGCENLTETGEKTQQDELIYSRDMSWIKESDVLVAEVSKPSIGVGYEIGKAEDMNKKILCLYRKQKNKKLSAMINKNPNLNVVKYETLKEAIMHIDNFFIALK